MTSLPAYCPHCKGIFPFSGIALAPGATIGLQSISTDCPICGFGDARVSDGVYRATQDAIEVLSGPNSTRAMAEALKALAEQLARGQISRDEALQKATTLSQRYASLLDACSKIGLPGLALLVSIIALYLQYEASKSSSVDAQKLLDTVTKQTFVMEELVKQFRSRENRHPSIAMQKHSNANQSAHRSEVKKQRRNQLKKRRSEFGRARTR